MSTESETTCDGCGVVAQGTPVDLPEWSVLGLGDAAAKVLEADRRPNLDLCPDCTAALVPVILARRAGTAPASDAKVALRVGSDPELQELLADAAVLAHYAEGEGRTGHLAVDNAVARLVNFGRAAVDAALERDRDVLDAGLGDVVVLPGSADQVVRD
jgi:hypothetical protein